MLNKIPTTLVTGFLGSGKTTIIAHLIEYLHSKGERVVYIKNELGFEDIDSKIIASHEVNTKELLNGVVCHTLVGPMSHAIDELIKENNPDRIIIETAGTDESSNPLVLSLMINSHPHLIRDGVITVIDVANFNGYKHLDEFNKDQTNFIDLIVFNKVELVDEQRKKAVVGYVREFNEKSPIVEAHKGVLNPDLAFGISLGEMNLDSKEYSDHDIQTFVYSTDQVLQQDCLEKTFQQLPKNIIRYKGYVKTNHGLKIINGVFKRFDWLDQDGEIDKQTKIIIIGYRVKAVEEQVRQLFSVCVKLKVESNYKR